MKRLANIAAALWVVAIAGFLLSTAFTQWPGLNIDSVAYTTPIVTSAATGEWKFDSYAYAMVRLGSDRFIQHGQLYQLVFGKVLRCSTYPSFFVCAAALNTLTVLLTTALCWRRLRTRSSSTAWLVASGAATVSALVCIMLQGRPEHLVPLIMLMPLAVAELGLAARWSRLTAYVALGLVVSLSPLPGVLCCLGIIAWTALLDRRQMWRELMVAAVISTVVAGTVITVACPVSLWQWVHNTLAAGGITPSNADVFLSPALFELPLWNFFVLAALGLLATGLVRRQLWWLAVCYTVLLVVLMPKLQIYTFAGFLPIIMIGLCSGPSDLLSLPPYLKHLPTWTVAAFAVCGTGAMLRTMLLAMLFYSDGVSFQQTTFSVRELESLLADTREKIGFVWQARPSFVAFGRPGNGLISVEAEALSNQRDAILDAYETMSQCKVRYVLLPQQGHRSAPPPALHDGTFELVQNGWTDRRAMLLGVKLGGSMPGYQFALYKRVE